MSSKCRNTPAAVQRQLRQEAHFGCCRCGHPLLDNAHIIPYINTHTFPPQDMLALCPTCHRTADDGSYSEKYLRELKANPHNQTHVKEKFLIEGDKMRLNLGGNRFIDSHSILTINDFEIIKMDIESGGYITLNLNLFDKYQHLVGIIDENKWIVDTSLVWDLEYKPRHLTIRNAPRKIFFDMDIKDGEVFLSGELYYLGQPIVIRDDGLWIAETNVLMQRNTFEGNGVAAFAYQISTKR